MTQTAADTFNPHEHLMQIKSREGSKDYLPVQWRLVWFRQACPQGTVDTEELEYDLDREVEAEIYTWNPEKKRSEKIIKKARGYARYRAVVTDGKGGRATGTKSENAANFADFGEKAETGAVGRALAALGYGTQFVADEFDEARRIVDAPVEPHPSQQAPQSTPQEQQSHVSATPALATEPQVLSIGKLCEHLGKSKPTNLNKMSSEEARELIGSLTQQYRAMRAKATNGTGGGR